MNRQPEPEKVQGRRRAHMPESENALWAKTRRRNMAAPRRRTERSESAAERARKAPRPTDSRRTFTPRRRNCAQSKYVRIVGTKKEQQKRCPTAHIAFRARRTPCRAVFCLPLLRPGGRKKARPGGRAFSERSSQIYMRK